MCTLWLRAAARRAAQSEEYASAASVPGRFLSQLATLCESGDRVVNLVANAQRRLSTAATITSQHAWARGLLGASAGSSAAACAVLEQLHSVAEDESQNLAVLPSATRSAPCMSATQAARFHAQQLARGVFVVGGMRMCQLAALETRHRHFFDRTLWRY
jgi:hypothetical protein